MAELEKSTEFTDFSNNGRTSSEPESTIGADEFIDIDRTNSGSSLLAYLNVVCVIVGTGILGLPYALQQGGWIGLLVLFLAWMMSIYTAIILIRCLYANGERRLSTYKEIATSAFGPIGGYVTYFFNCSIALGGPVLYIVLSGANLNQLCQGTVAEIGAVNWTIICTCALAIPFVLVKTMREVAFTSAIGVVVIFIVGFAVLGASIVDKPNQQNVEHDVVIWNKFPAALATIAFSFGGNITYPHVEASMSKPKQWPMVVFSALSSCAVLYFIVAISGYLIYGRNVQSPVYNSLPPGAAQTLCLVVITVNILISVPIFTTSFSLDIENMFSINQTRFTRTQEFLVRGALRLSIMVVIGIIACTVPYFGALMSLIGAFGNCTLVLVFPVIFYLKLTGVRNKPFYELIWCALIVLLGLVGLVFGTMEAIQELIAAYA